MPCGGSVTEWLEPLQRRLGMLDDETLQRIAMEKLEGYTNEEIA